MSSSNPVGAKYYKSYYLAISGPGYQKIDPKSILASIADFESLTYEAGPHKTIARLNLLASKACYSPNKKYHLMHRRLDENQFEIIDDNGHLGCGFIPSKLLVEFLGC